jgi:hypothetical protein
MDSREIGKKRIELLPRRVPRGDALTLSGTGWDDCVVRIRIDGVARPGIHVAQGFSAPGGIRPDSRGAFLILVPTLDLKPGEHRIQVSSADRTRRAARFTVVARKDEEPDEPESESPFGREVELWSKRFSHVGYVPPGMIAARQRDLERLRQLGKGLIPLGRPITPGCNWTPVGPGAGYDRANPGQLVYSGKIKAIAIDPTAPANVYVGASGGGVWKTTNSGATWAPKIYIFDESVLRGRWPCLSHRH